MRSGLVILKRTPVVNLSRIRSGTKYVRGANGPVERRRRDEVGEKLYRLYRTSLEARNETGQRSGPFALQDWRK